MWISKTLATILTILAMCVASACSSDSPEAEPAMPDTMKLRLYLDFDISSPTRATPSAGDYQPGSIYENMIDFEGKDFMVLFFDKDDNYIGSFTDTEIKTSDDNRKRTFIEGSVSSTLLDGCDYMLKVLLLANWGSYPAAGVGLTTITDIADLSAFDFETSDNDGEGHGDLIVDETHHIPMFGIIDTKTLEFDSDMTADLGAMHMLRAFAKIEVEADTENSSVKTLDKVFMNKVNRRGFMFPPGVTCESDYRKDNFNDDYTSSPAIPANTTTDSDIPFVKTDNGKWVIYVPEFANIIGNETLDEEDRARIGVRFSGIDHTFWIDFKYYETPPSYVTSLKKGDHFNIMRNNWYHYVVSKHPDSIEVKLDVTPYSSVVLEPDFGLDRDEDGNIITPAKP
ncbi:MAG: hypothetical protein K2J49_07990 [Muribaculaceae bacterium]|nr:hypothetical protein [Muribaculaceae bacterium]